MKDWSYFDKFEGVIDKYMPARGEGETMASQIVTAVNKLVYKWYNDGDVFDNTAYLDGWANDLSSYANWLAKYANLGYILDDIYGCESEGDYEDLLAALADEALNEGFLADFQKEKTGSIYDCSGDYRLEELTDEEEDEWDDDYYDDEWDEDDDWEAAEDDED